MRTLRKLTAVLVALSLLAGCSKRDQRDAMQFAGILVLTTAVVVASVPGVLPLIRAATEESPLEKMSASQSFPDNRQAQALASAAEKGDVKEIDRLVDAGADVNAVGVYGLTLPQWLLFHPNKDGFRRLLERGVDPHKLSVWTGPLELRLRDFESQQSSLVHWAAYRTAAIGPDYLRMVLEIGKGDPNFEPPDRKTRPIMKALKKEDGEAFCLLYSHGAELEFFTDHGKTPIEEAARQVFDNFRLVYFMLLRGVSISYAGKMPNYSGFQGAMQHALDNGKWARQPFDAECLWFWRCIDYLEQRGMSFNPMSRFWGAALRPVALDSGAPVDLLSTAPEPRALSRTVTALGVVLTLPRPFWDRAPGSGVKISCRSDVEGGKSLYQYYHSELTDKNAMHLSLEQISGKALAELSGAAVTELATRSGYTASLVESAADHNIYRLSNAKAKKVGGYLYTGLCNGTFVTLRQAIWKSGQAADEADDAYVLQGMRQINLSPGVLPPKE